MMIMQNKLYSLSTCTCMAARQVGWLAGKTADRRVEIGVKILCRLHFTALYFNVSTF